MEFEKRTLRPRNAKRKTYYEDEHLDDEEEVGPDLLIFEFESGVLKGCQDGTTLYSYLSSKIDLTDYLVAELIDQRVDLNVGQMPYVHHGGVSSYSSSSSAAAYSSPTPKRRSKSVNIVSPPSGSSSSSSSSRVKKSPSTHFLAKSSLSLVMPTQYQYFVYEFDSSEDINSCSSGDVAFALPGIRSITPAPFTADPEKLLAARLTLMDEQAAAATGEAPFF